jgi:hypothetical protein
VKNPSSVGFSKFCSEKMDLYDVHSQHHHREQGQQQQRPLHHTTQQPNLKAKMEKIKSTFSS